VTRYNLEEIDLAFKQGDSDRALSMLREYVGENKSEAKAWFRLATAEEQLGNSQQAELAYLQCLHADPENVLTCLYLGYLYQNHNELQKAVTLYSLASELAPRLFTLKSNNAVAPETRQRAAVADATLRRHFSDLHREVVGSASEVETVYEGIWPQTHDSKFSYALDAQKPHLFYLPSLSKASVENTAAYIWCQHIENEFAQIKHEFEKALPDIIAMGRPYISKVMTFDKSFENLVGSLNWTALDLYINGVENGPLTKYFTETLKILATAPLYNLEDTPYEIFFSLLKPGQHIPPHYGQSNHSHTVHLPISIPKGCRLRVDKTWYHWQEGKLIIFDDSFDHEAINESDELRVVLIFSVWHSGLSELERDAIKRSFNARSSWLKNRELSLVCCLGNQVVTAE